MNTQSSSQSETRPPSLGSRSSIFIAGHRGMVGSAIWRCLESKGYTNLIGKTHAELDLIRQKEVEKFFAAKKPDYVILASAKVGGIGANSQFRAQFIYENLMIQANVIHAAYTHGVKKLLFLGSSCIYPKLAPQPMAEDALLTMPLEPTNEPYAIAKIAGIRMCDAYNRQYGTNFISAMPTNLYGPGDNYHAENSHVLPALIRKMHEAKQSNADSVTIWGSGKPLREFLYSDDLAEACVFLLENIDYKDIAFEDASGTIQAHINVGSGKEISIRQLAEMVKDVVGFRNELVFDTSKPDGTPRKLMDSTRLRKFGWEPKINLKKGIEQTYRSFTGVAQV
ncbi:MAG: GDP-L-fucose synthase [Deltaproteobacteria bacterium]|nr:GDP-L-fucose synthase [Deltaproteobacteria bacterium]